MPAMPARINRGPHTNNNPKTLFTESADTIDHVLSLLNRTYATLPNADPCRHNTVIVMRELYQVQRRIRNLQFRQ